MCAQALKTALDTCQKLGVPVAFNKVEGPSPQLTFLGIQIDTCANVLSLLPLKPARISSSVKAWLSRKAATKRELQSLIGFLSRLIDASKVGSHFIRLNSQVRSDLQWWACFVRDWNGQSLVSPLFPSASVTMDASDSWGCGALISDGKWFQVQWPLSWASVHIAPKELVPVVIAVAVWGKQWPGQTVLVCSDNMAVVAALKVGLCQDVTMMHLLCCLHFFSAYHQLRILSDHVPCKENLAADALSCNYKSIFSSVAPQCQAVPFQHCWTCCSTVVRTGPHPAGG